MIHSVAPVTNRRGWGNVMYIPAAPWCPRNEQYAAGVREALRTGSEAAAYARRSENGGRRRSQARGWGAYAEAGASSS